MSQSIIRLFKYIGGYGVVFRNWLLWFVALFFAAGSAFGNTYIARNAAMGGAGVASSNYDAASTANPALLTEFTERDDFSLIFPAIGAEVSDEDDVLDSLDFIADTFSTLEDQINSGGSGAEESKDDIINELERIDGVPMRANLGAVISISKPSKRLAWAVAVQTAIEAGAVALFDEDDEAIIDAAILAGDTDFLDDINSEGVAIAAAVTELTFSIAREFQAGNLRYSIGVTPKYQRVDTVLYVQKANTFDSDDFEFDSSTYSNDDSNFNIDIGGSLWVTEKINIGLMVRDLISEDYDTVMLPDTEINSAVYKVDTMATVGVAYSGSTLTGTVDIDLTKNESFEELDKTQFLRAGIEFNAFDWAQLRAGYRHDLEDTRDDLFTVGVGLSPFKVFHLDLTGMVGENDAYGAALEFRFTF